jgi:hypothetical protein
MCSPVAAVLLDRLSSSGEQDPRVIALSVLLAVRSSTRSSHPLPQLDAVSLSLAQLGVCSVRMLTCPYGKREGEEEQPQSRRAAADRQHTRMSHTTCCWSSEPRAHSSGTVRRPPPPSSASQDLVVRTTLALRARRQAGAALFSLDARSSDGSSRPRIPPADVQHSSPHDRKPGVVWRGPGNTDVSKSLTRRDDQLALCIDMRCATLTTGEQE